MAASSSTRGGSPDSVLVSQLPTNKLLGDLKALLAGHFANFGRILRLSCALQGKEKERVGHIQFSSSTEAHNAWKNGTIMEGHRVIITITEKIPNTKPLAVTPLPKRSTLLTPSSSVSKLDKAESPETKPEATKLQTTLKSYFKQKSTSPKTEDKKNVKCVITASDVFNEAVASGSATASSSAAAAMNPESQVDSKPAHCPEDRDVKENKPNVCNQLVTYQGTSSSIPTGNSSLIPVSTNRTQIRRTRSLREILNLDMSKMKVVKTASASDVLALQYFTGGSQPFALSLMFGRIPGNVIMPVRSLMESVKHGMDISESTIEMVFNTILRSVLRREVQQSANTVLKDTLINQIASEALEQLQEVVSNEQVTQSVENEIEREVDLVICCEEAVEAMLGLICNEHIEETFSEDIRAERLLSKGVNCCYRKVTEVVVPQLVSSIVSSAKLDHLCEEVVDDILESPFIDRCVKVVAGNALQDCLRERDASDWEESSDSSCSVAQKSLKALSDTIPSIDSHERTEDWLLAHVYNVNDNEDVDPIETESLSSIGTNTSCSAKSSSSRPLSDVSEPVNETTSLPDTSESSIVENEKKRSFLSPLGSIKRKVSWFCDFFGSKRPRLF